MSEANSVLADLPVVRAPSSDSDAARDRLSALLLRTGQRDRSAFTLVYALTKQKIFGICLKVCGDHAAAEDVMLDVYMTVWQRSSTWLPGGSSPITWLSAIARNRSIDWLRAQKRADYQDLSEVQEPVDTAPDAVALILDAQTASALELSLSRLPPHTRNAIRSAFYLDHTYSQLASDAGVPLGTMKSWIRRGLCQMRLDLAAEN